MVTFGSAKLLGENDDVIRIMSIHKSKGLEFPIVFVSNVGKQFNTQSLKHDKILLHNELGIGLKYINHEIQIEYDTNAKTAVKNKLEIENISEEMRVLYVALTRAKEKLIITGVCKDYINQHEDLTNQANIYNKKDEKINPILLKKCKSYLDWILLVNCYETQEFDKIASIKVISKQEVIDNKTVETIEEDILEKLNNAKFNKEDMEELKKQIEYEYQFKVSTITQTKTSVSEIKRRFQENMQDEENNEVDISIIQNKVTNLAKPKFLNNDKETKLTGTEKGTLMHMCLQKLNPSVEYSKETINSMIEEMVLKNIITHTEKASINQMKILKFLQSNLWKEIKNAKQVFKEKPFYIEINANEIQEENKEDKILVQGIIDLYFVNEKEELVLVDYKTDYVEKGKEQELIDKYKKQLDLYKIALENSLNKKVARTYIYSVYLDKEILI